MPSPTRDSESFSKKSDENDQERFRRLVNTTGALVVAVDPQARITLFNHRCQEVTGYTEEEVLGKNIVELLIPEDEREDLMTRFQNLVLGESPLYSPQVHWMTKSGEKRLMRWNNTFITDKDGNVEEIFGIGIDITAEKEMESALEKAEAKYDNLITKSLEGLVIISTKPPGIAFSNPVASEISGYSSKELTSLSSNEFFALLHPEDQGKLIDRIERVLKGGKPVPREFRIVRKNGSLAWIRAFGSRTDYDGKPALQLTFIDITDWKEAQIALEESEAQFRSLFDSVPVGIFRTAPDGQIHDANPALVEMLGYKIKEELLKHKASEFYVHAEARKRWEELIKQEEVVRVFEAQFQRRDGEVIWIELNARAIRDANGEVYCYEGTLEDITERKEAEIKLMSAHQRAEFLVDLMAHDLNNINQGIMLTLELIESDEELPKHLREGLQASLDQVERSAELISNVKRFQSLESEPRRLSTRDLSPPFHAAVRAVERAFPTKQVFLSTNIQDQKYWVYGDGFLTELFFNILHNAVKMDRNPLVKIEVQAKENSNEGFVKIEVQDQGPGVPDSEKKRIFNRYPNGMEGVRGSGIGLTLVQRILQRYGGQIWVEDRIHGNHSQGANFVVLIPRGER
ncbi:MAG: PAS domain S-box protein [Candidatus Hermodarchaeia archaeon]